MNTNPSTDQKASQGNLLQRFATSLRFQLSATTILMAVVPLMIAAVALGTLVSNQVRESMTQSALDHLTAIREAKAGEIGSYFGEREGDMAVLVETTGTLQQDAFNQLLALQTVKKGQIEDYLQTTFNMVHALKDNPTTAQAIVEFKQAFEAERGRTGGRQWTAVHEKFNAVFEDANNDFGFYDIFLIAEDGDVIYTVAQEPDLGQNLVTGDLQNSGLGQVFQEAHTQEVAVADFAPYAPTGDLFAAFVAGAVTDITGTVVGVVAIQIPIDKIDAIMQERAGLAETGETYLVGSDNLFRSNSRFVDEDTIINPAYVVDTEATQAALAGNSGLDVILDYRGERVLSAYAPLEITGLDWAILAEIDLVEALAPRIAGAEKDFFTQYKETYGYYDVFLIASDGYIFYTVDHELDYQTNILTGPYQDSNLAALVADVIENQEFGIADFARYEPSQGAPAAFAAAPLLRGDEVEMVVAVQLSLDKINAIMQTTAGLGESGETYLVGPDEMWRSDSRFLVELGVESTVLNTETTVRTEASLSALANEPPGTRIIDDYRGERVLSSWMPLVLDEPDSDHPEGITWAVIAEQDESEALATVATVATFITTLSLGLLGVMAVVAAVVGSWIAGRLVEPIVGLTGSAAAIASGDLDVVVAPSPSRNEVGVLTNSFATMTQQLRDMVGSLRETADNLSERTRELEASQRVTFAASERTSPDELLGLVVDLIRDQFDLYHAQVYLVDDEQEAAVLRESTGYAGSQLLQKGHQIPLDRASLVTRAIHSGEPVLVSDTAEDPNFMPNPLLPETRSELVVPLRIGEQVFGALDAQDMTPGRFTESTVALFRTMADQVAFLFENSDLLSRVTEQTESLTIFTTQLRIAADIAAQLGTVLDPDQLLQQVVELMQSRFGLYHAHIYVLDEATSTLSIRAGSGEVGRVLREEGHAIPLDREKSLVARAARDQEAVLIEDTTLESDFMPNPLLPQTRSELSVPLVAGGRVLGVLDMQDDQSGRFSESDVDTFTTLAGQIAVALQNAGLFERVEAGAQETRVRLEVSQALAGAQTEQDVLDALLQQAGVYPEAQVVLSLYDLQAEEPTLVVASASSFESGIAPAEIGSRFPASQFAIINLLVSGEPLAVSNLSSDERIDPPTRQYLTGLGNASMVITAMVVGDEQIGILRAGSSKAGFFDQHKLHLYQTLAEQGAAALQAARLRAQIQEREARFTGFANATDYGFGLGELSGQLTYANPGLLNILGEDNPEDAYANTFFDYYSEADRKALETEILPIVLEKGQWVGELALLSSKGKLTPTEQNIFLIYDEQGAPRMVANIITDITERKRAEQEIQRSERQYRELNAGLQDGIVSVDLEGNTLSCNPAFEEMTGYSLKDAQERTLLDMTPEKWHAMEAKILEEQVLVRGYSDLYEKEVLHKDGTIFPIEMTAYLSRDEQGNPSGFWAYIRDITERKRAEKAIRENEERFRTVADFTYDWEYWMGPDGQFVYVSPACERIMGYTREEFMEDPSLLERIAHPDDRHLVSTLLNEWVTSEEDHAVDFRVIARDGTECWIGHASQAVYGDDGTFLGQRASNREITVEKQAEEERERFTLQLGTASDIAAQVNAILDPDELLNTIIPLLKERFGLYYAHVFVLDEAAGELRLRAGYGEPGRAMLEQGLGIPLDQEVSLVARAARSREIVVVDDVTLTPDFLPNPLLPDTKSEVAVPLLVGERVLGVFDVQHDEADYFTQADLDVFSTLAGQVATALQNADYFEEAQRERALLDSVLDNMPIGVMAVDNEFQLLRTNEVASALLGRAVTDREGNVYVEQYDVINTDTGERYDESALPLIKAVTQGGRHMADDVAVRQPDGTLIPQLVNAGPLLDPSGEQMGGVVIFADITERKQAEQAIRENEEKFRTVADFTYDWEYWMGPDGQFVYVSPACERIMGYTREEFMEDPSLLERIAHPDDRHLVSTILNEWAASEENHAVEFRVITRDGEERWIGHASQAVYGEDGRFLGQRASNRDATESKLAEQEIQRSEREYRELNAGLRDGIVSVNLEGNTLSCNPAFEEMTGYSLKDAQERTLLDMTPEKWHAMEAKILEEQVLVRGYSDLYEKEVIRKDGTIFPIEMTAYLSRDEQGNPAGFWAYIHDITERKRAAQAIRENEERFRTVADFTYDWEYWMGPDGQFVYVSPSCERIMGYTREEFMEDPSLLERIAYPDDRHLVSTLLNEWVTSEEDHAVDFRVITRDGEERWIGHASQAVYGDDGAFLGQRASNRDITVEKQAEIEQEHFATELDQIFNSTAEGMRVVNENFDVLRANAAFVELSGMTQDQVLNTKCYKSLHGAVCHTPDCTLVRVLSGEDRLDEELEKERADGTRFPCQVMATPFKTPDGQVVGIVEVFRDITERKQVEEERERFTLQLGTAADIAGQVNAILDPDELLNTIIPLLKERFGLYYAHVFVLDEDAGELRLRAGYGEPGRAMLEQGLSIPLDREASLVARAARSKENVVVHDVTVAPDFMPNPLLPDTKSEVAVPMVVGDQVLGVFDVQHDQANYFTQADLDVFSTLAGQVATALQNAQLFEQQQRADAALQQRIIALTQPLADTGGLGFDDLFNVDEIQALQDAFAEATGVASIITDPEGVPITEASNFCKMCQMVRSTEQGQANCFKSDAELGKPHPDGLAMQPCLSGGLWDAGVSIFLGDAHIANWLIGQVLTDDTQVEQVIEYGKSLGLHEDEFSAAVDQVTRMPLEQFEQAGRALGALASQLSTMAQQNVQQARDITQRQQVEEIVRESEERFRTVADFTYDWEYWMGPDGQFIYVSPACERIMGYTREEFMEDPSLLERIAHPDDRHLVSTILNEWVMSEENHEVDFRVITRDDEERWISHASQAVYGDDGAFLGQRASNRDATESKRAEASVQESEERFRGVFENVMMGLYRSTPDGQIIMANPALVRMLGYSSFEELAQRDLEDDGFEEDQARSIFKERIENEGQIVQESVWTKLNGDALIVRESARAIRDETGNVLYYEGTVEDITERKRAEEELLRLSSAVEQTGDGIAVADLEGNILYVNPAWAQMHGYTVEEIQGKHLFMFYTEEQAKSEVMPFNEIVMQAGANSGEIGHVRKDGVIFPTLMTTTVLKDEAGNPVGLVGTARDITATKRLNMISRGLNAAGDEDEILQLLAESTAEAGALSASLQYIELDQTGEPEWLQMAATWQQEGESPAPVGTRFYIPEFPFSKLWLANPDEPLLVADVAVDERVDENVKAMLLGMHIAAFVVIPLAQAGQRIGLVTFEWPTAHEFTEQEVEIYQALISIVAPVVVNRRLLIAQERALTETLYRISSGLNTASDEDEILRALAQPAIDAQVGRVDLSYVELDAAGEPEWLVTAAVWQREGEIMFPAGTRYRLADLPFADLWLADPDKPQLIADVAKDEQLDETIRGLMEQAGSRAMAVVPLYQAGRWLGLLSLTWSKAHEFGEQEAEIYRALIGLGSPSVANRRAYLSEQIALAQTEDQAQRLAVLHEASQQLSQTENLDEIYKVVAIQTPRVVIAERASVALLRGAGDYLEVLALQGESGAIPVGMQLPIEETASGMAVQENRVVTISNTADSPLIDSQGIAKQGLNSTMCAPLVVGGRAVGTLNVGNLEPDAYTERDETMLLQMASLLASTIENRRLFEQTEALYQAGRRINEAEDLKEIMTAVVEAVPIPEINRAMLVMFDRDLDGDVAAMVVTSVWYSGVGTEPTPVGTRYPREIFKTVDVLLSPEPLFLNDVQHDERVIDPATQGVLKQQNIRTMAVLPLWAGMRQLGALLIEGEDVHYFADDERDRYTALARQMAAAVDARNLFQQTQDALAQTDALYSISRGLSAAVDVGEQLNVLAHIAMDAGMSTANLLYIDLNQANEPEWVEIVALWQREGKSPIPVGSRFYLPEFPLADLWIGSPDEAQIIANIASDERVDENARNLLAQSGTRALIIIPLAQSGRWVGIVTLGWAEAREFTDQDVMIYNALIGLASPAVAGRRLMDNLERIVSERTEQISTASDIAGQVNAILDPNELLNEVVSQLHERFGLYHVHAYLLDEPLHELLVQADPAEVARIMGQRELVIYAGSGEAGQVLLEQRHTIPLNREHSLVARAARTRKLVSVADTDLEPDFMPNPLLPETRSEVSVPLVIGDRVLGVLDVQDDQPNRFSQADLDVFSTLAGQIATALQNAGYVEQVEARLKVSQALAGTQTEDDVLDAMTQTAGFYPQARVSIYTLDPETDEYTIILRRENAFESGIVSPLAPGVRYVAAQYSLLQQVMTGNPLVSSNLPLDERLDSASLELVSEVGYTSAAFLPIIVADQHLGLVVATCREEGFFDERKLRLYQALAEQGGIALFAARLYEDTQKVAERLQEVNQVKSEFMADMSHELRTPLNSIIGYAELMLMGISDMDPDTLEDIQAIYDNGRHLLKLINDILDLSKIEAGRMELNIEQVYIDSLLNELRTTNAGLLVGKPIDVRVDVEADLPPIEADRVRISQIVNNLVGNAIKFTERGSITLRGHAGEQGWVCIEVEDTGVGMDEDDMREIFERYRQVGDVGARAKGTGLGLSITRYLVQMHGGVVDVRSEPGKGSIFTVRLPVEHTADGDGAGNGESGD